MKFISRVEQDISLVRCAHTRNKFHISSQPCNILYVSLYIYILIILSKIKKCVSMTQEIVTIVTDYKKYTVFNKGISKWNCIV